MHAEPNVGNSMPFSADELVSASELREFVFCERSWHLSWEGHTVSREMQTQRAAGVTHHQARAAGEHGAADLQLLSGLIDVLFRAVFLCGQLRQYFGALHRRLPHGFRNCDKRITRHKCQTVYRYRKKSTDIGLNPDDSILGSPTLRGSYDFGKSIDIGKLTPAYRAFRRCQRLLSGRTFP
jgi:hypothetical protein